MKLFKALLLLAAAPSVCSSAALTVTDPLALQRAQLSAALQAVEQRRALPETSAELQQYPLYPYLVAAQLRQSLDAGGDNDDAIAQFLAASGEEPYARALKREWWKSLAQRAQWPRLLAELSATISDPDLQCSRLSALLATGSGVELREDVLRLWLSGDSRPQSCVQPFEWLKQEGELTEERRLQRARLALDAGNLDLADFMITTLPEAVAAPLQREARLLRDPARELRGLIAAPDAALPVASLQRAWTQLIRKQPEEIEPLLAPLLQAQNVAPPEAGEFIRQLALGLAWNRDARALTHFMAMPESASNEASAEWRVRAALWSGQWPLALDWITRLPPALAAQPRWRYWQARALEQTGDFAGAERLYLALLDANNYYAVLAAARTQAPLVPRPQPAPPSDPALHKRLATHPALIRSRELFLIERNDLARAEWNFALDGADAATLTQAARLAFEWEWRVQAISSAARARVFDDFALLYPRPYEREVLAAAKSSGVPSAWIYSVMRQESLYDPRAVSRRDAYGLVQLLLPTARATAQRWQLPLPARDDLFVPDVNLRLGAALLRDMTEKFDNRLILALGAYNAGPGALARWLPQQPMDADIWIENIPYNETRNYIQKILWHIVVFGWRENGQPQDLAGLLQPLGAPAP